MRLEIKN